MNQDIVSTSGASRPAPFFVADCLALDFLNSIATPHDTPVEWITNGNDLLAWLVAAGLIDRGVADQMRARFKPSDLDAVAAEARALREWFRGFVFAHEGRPLPAGAMKELAPLNDLLARDESYLSIRLRAPQAHVRDRVKESKPGLELSRQRRWKTAASLLQPLAEAMAAMVSAIDFSLVKKCESHKCTILMVDTSRRHSRRWCSMALCGNRAKQAAHRDRMKKKPTRKKTSGLR